MSDTGIVEIHGRQYKTVAKRIQEFREAHPVWAVETELLEAGDVVRVKATIRDEHTRVISTGYAEEIRGATNILKTSAIETCETSAVGRALGFLSLGGTAIASAEEMELALEQQKELAGMERLLKHNEAVREWFNHITAIKNYLIGDEYGLAYEAYAEIPRDAIEALWVAPTKGGIFTTTERGKMKSNEWNAASHAYHGTEGLSNE